MTECSPAKIVEHPQFSKPHCMKIRSDISPWMLSSFYLFLKAHSFPLATLSEKRLLFETHNVRGQICFRSNGDCCLFICVRSA